MRFVALLFVLLLAALPARAQAPLPWQPVTGIKCCHVAPYSTWNPAINTVTGAYSNGNLTFTCFNCVGTYSNTFGTNNHINGKWHVEWTTTGSVGCCYALGFVQGTLPATQNLGFNGYGVGYYNSGGVNVGNGTTLTLGTYTVGQTICAEIDLNLLTVQFRVGAGGSWSSPINIATLPVLNLYPAVSFGFTITDAVTLNVGATAFTCPVSAGYTAWG